MAEEGIEKKPEKKKNLPLKWIISGIVAVALLSGGILGYLLLSKSPAENAEVPGATAGIGKIITPSGGTSQIFPLESFVVNLNDPGGKRYLKTTIELESFGKGFAQEIQSKIPQIKDAIVLILSSKSLADIQGIDGKISLRKALILKLNTIMKQNKIRNLYFTEFVIQ